MFLNTNSDLQRGKEEKHTKSKNEKLKNNGFEMLAGLISSGGRGGGGVG
jgi:hypothetical protein